MNSKENPSQMDSVQNKPHLVILYGSQTGTAHKLAELLVLQARYLFRSTYSTTQSVENGRPNLTTRLQSMDSYLPLSQLARETGIVLFVCSTTGYGAPPDTMRQFWQRIMHRSLPPRRSLPSLRFAVLGLGDSSYPKFNVVAKKLRQRLVQLGASPLPINVPNLAVSSKQSASVNGLGLADEQAELGMYDLLSQWVPQLWNILSGLWHIPIRIECGDNLTWSYLTSSEFIESTWPRFDVQLHSKHVDIAANGVSGGRLENPNEIEQEALLDWPRDDEQISSSSDCQIRWFRIVQNRRVTAANHFQDTRLVEIVSQPLKPEDPKSTFSSGADFLPGDVFFLQPANNPYDVASLLHHTATNPTERVLVTTRDPCQPIDPLLKFVSHNRPDNVGISAAWLATYYFDLNAIPSPEMFSALAVINRRALRECRSTDENCSRLQLERDRLHELCNACWSPDAMDDLNDYVTRPRRRVIETLLDFPMTTSHLNLISWFDVLPAPIRARPYSIASGPPRIELLVAVVSYRTQMSTARRGLASTYLASRTVGDMVPGWIASQVAGGFNFELACQTGYTCPCLLIAPGTGIAPFRSFLQHQRALHPTEPEAASNLLFFGCRFPDKDFYFQTEWNRLTAENRMQLITAFSRVPPGPQVSGRVYVQHQLRKHADQVWTYLSQPNCFIYVAGNAKSMPNEVREALIFVCETAGDLTSTESEAFLSKMEVERRLQIEAWS
ncbi:NADPH-dependent diflavin oxidoreductase 1 [Fasciola gigantica]|uniref:NADPH-dependent diflavin oxidoreductase 1 n=1 Tax=Fasciola gigantica TaxID=46835 RepID=A0A504Z1B6_FASGI|nr:NADPH-dependent diflavin oxidoreductase 1 [Fasciola gigantica]